MKIKRKQTVETDPLVIPKLVLSDIDFKISMFYMFKKIRQKDGEFHQRTEIYKREPNGNNRTVNF